MRIFHDEDDGPAEAIRGLPGPLPEGETIVWQGGPRAAGLLVHAFHARFVAGYFAIVAAWSATKVTAAGGDMTAIAAKVLGLALAGGAAVGILWLIAFAMARAAVFTITSHRVMIRHGVAIPKFINIPFSQVSAVGKADRGSHVDIAIELAATGAPYIHLWPFARPMRVNQPVPLLRGLSRTDAAIACAAISDAMLANAPDKVRVSAHQTLRPVQHRSGATPAAPATA